MQGNTKKKIAPVVIAALVVLYIGPLVGMVAYAAGLLGAAGGWGVLPFLLLYAAVIVGVLAAMAQRLREIDGGLNAPAHGVEPSQDGYRKLPGVQVGDKSFRFAAGGLQTDDTEGYSRSG